MQTMLTDEIFGLDLNKDFFVQSACYLEWGVAEQKPDLKSELQVTSVCCLSLQLA